VVLPELDKPGRSPSTNANESHIGTTKSFSPIDD
jgi:hypothetical protein